MSHWYHLVFIAGLLTATQACTGEFIEMDPEFEDKSSSATTDPTDPTEPLDTTDNDGLDESDIGVGACVSEFCDPAVVCAGDEPCPSYACCPCAEEDLGICDEFNPYRIWSCEEGYLLPSYCEGSAICAWDLEGDVGCRSPQELEDGECLGPTDFDPDCFECFECESPNVSYCDYGFGNDAILSCEPDSFGRLCWVETPCIEGQQCEQGLKTNQAQCAYPGEYNCEFLGCTGVEFCEWEPGPGSGPGFGQPDCGACGCCEPNSGDLCWNDQQWGSYRLEGHQDDDGPGDDHSCYEPEPCPGNKLCVLDDDGDARCE